MDVCYDSDSLPIIIYFWFAICVAEDNFTLLKSIKVEYLFGHLPIVLGTTNDITNKRKAFIKNAITGESHCRSIRIDRKLKVESSIKVTNDTRNSNITQEAGNFGVGRKGLLRIKNPTSDDSYPIFDSFEDLE